MVRIKIILKKVSYEIFDPGSSRGLGKALIDQLSPNNEIVGISRSETNSAKYQNISLDLNNLVSLRNTLKHKFFKKP